MIQTQEGHIPRQYKEDNRPKWHGWAPGSYLNRCPQCKEGFIGDKRASMCADCAYKIPLQEEMTRGQVEAALYKAVDDYFEYTMIINKEMIINGEATMELFKVEAMLANVRKWMDLLNRMDSKK